jgi:hypothetical protein
MSDRDVCGRALQGKLQGLGRRGRVPGSLLGLGVEELDRGLIRTKRSPSRKHVDDQSPSVEFADESRCESEQLLVVGVCRHVLQQHPQGLLALAVTEQQLGQRGGRFRITGTHRHDTPRRGDCACQIPRVVLELGHFLQYLRVDILLEGLELGIQAQRFLSTSVVRLGTKGALRRRVGQKPYGVRVVGLQAQGSSSQPFGFGVAAHERHEVGRLY